MVHMVAFEARLGEILSFKEFELLSEVDKIRGPNKGVVEIVPLEDIVDIEGLNLINRNWEDPFSGIRSGAGGNGFRTDSGSQDYD